MNNEFSRYLVKEYKYWGVYIHPNQGYLGRCVIWCKRENATDLTEATAEEREEFFDILKNLKGAISKIFQSDWFNYASLGNETRHLHCHFIPRYAAPREFMKIKFEDKLWGHNYKTDHSFVTPPPVQEAIRDKIKETLA